MTDEQELHERIAVCEQRLDEHHGRLEIADSERLAIDKKIMSGLEALTNMGKAQLQATETLQHSVNALTENDETQDRDLGQLKEIVRGLVSEMFRSKAAPYGALIGIISSIATKYGSEIAEWLHGLAN